MQRFRSMCREYASTIHICYIWPLWRRRKFVLRYVYILLICVYIVWYVHNSGQRQWIYSVYTHADSPSQIYSSLFLGTSHPNIFCNMAYVIFHPMSALGKQGWEAMLVTWSFKPIHNQSDFEFLFKSTFVFIPAWEPGMWKILVVQAPVSSDIWSLLKMSLSQHSLQWVRRRRRLQRCWLLIYILPLPMWASSTGYFMSFLIRQSAMSLRTQALGNHRTPSPVIVAFFSGHASRWFWSMGMTT